MRTGLLILLFGVIAACSSKNQNVDPHLRARAENVTITRDQWGVPHIHGKTDADAVFGLMYAQCEESFERVENNYLRVLGRMAEVEGEAYYYQDLLMQLSYDTAKAKADYQRAPDWLKQLCHAFSDGINYYLSTHPEVQPRVLGRFEPWLPMLFPDGAYLSLNLGGLQMEDITNLYGQKNNATSYFGFEKNVQAGSNAFAVAPAKSENGNTLLYINPHVSFYFRTEAHISSDEGLNAYGAVTWGQFFIFQGFNEFNGWMHTSTAADAADLYLLKSSRVDDHHLSYEVDGVAKKLITRELTVRFKTGSGFKSGKHTAYLSHYGPVLGKRNGQLISLRTSLHSAEMLQQSWLRMKTKSLSEFENILAMRTNISTNTMYADAAGNIAYWHGNFVPKRNASLDWSGTVDGSTTATEWSGIHELAELPHLINPSTGWLQNCNSSPYSAAGSHALDKALYPPYMAPDPENFRSARAIHLLSSHNKISMDKLVQIGYDRHLPLFDSLLPSLLSAYQQMPSASSMHAGMNEAMQLLMKWNKQVSKESVATTLAVFWASELIALPHVHDAAGDDQFALIKSAINQTTAVEKLQVLAGVINGLQNFYGTWKMEWGAIHRFQRTPASNQSFDDEQESSPVGLASAFFGALPSYETTWGKGNKKYGYAGNSFVAVVEFFKTPVDGRRIKARSVVTGGQMFDSNSPHFSDQSAMFLEGRFKDVLFYPDEYKGTGSRTYVPGN